MKTTLVTDRLDYYILLDEEGTFKVGDIAFSFDNDYYTVEEDDIAYANINHYKVIGHLPKGNSPLLKNIPLLPVITGGREEDVEALAKIVYPDGHSKWGVETDNIHTLHKRQGFIEGYKAASKGYTEEQIIEAYIQGTKDGRFHTSYESDEEYVGRNAKEYVQALPAAIPTPIDFIIVVEPWIPTTKEFITIPNEQNIPVIQGEWEF